jgi:DNA-binding PadR family transcriptional regulator
MSNEVTLLGRGILGLLMQEPLSGYDIRRIFTQTPMGTFSDSPGAIYPALKRLERDGLVRGRIERSSGLRQRKIFRLTPDGRSVLKRWLSTPVTHDDVVRDTDELMLRFGFMDAGIGEAASIRFLQSLQHELTAYLPDLERYLESHGREMPKSGKLALESGIRSYDALLQWTRHALTEYDKHEKGGKRS